MTKPVKVGDIIVDINKDKAKVLEVFQYTFIISCWNCLDEAGEVYSFKEIEKRGWKVERKKEQWVPRKGEDYIFPDPASLNLFVSSNWYNDILDDLLLERGLVYHPDDEEACIAHAKRMLEVGHG